MSNRFNNKRKATSAIFSAIVFAHIFFAAGAFAVGAFLKLEDRLFSILPGAVAVAFLVACIIQVREASNFRHLARMNAEIP